MPVRARNAVAVLAGAAGLAAGAHSLARLGRAGRGRHRLGPGDPAERAETVSVVVPARDEAGRVGGCVAALLGQDAAVAGSLVEDLALAAALKAAGGRLELRLAPGLAAVRMYGRFGDLWEGLAKNLAEVWGAGAGDLARQAARALAGVAPWLALAARPGPPARRVALAGGLLQLTVRAGGRLVAGADPRLALAYPAADLVLLAVYADSVRRRRTGAPVSWKGRTYPADRAGARSPAGAAPNQRSQAEP